MAAEFRDATADEWALRADLAAAFRLAARFGWSESVGNHFSAVVNEDGPRFLLNPRWRLFELVTASDLLLLDASDESVMQSQDAPDVSAWAIHGGIHRAAPHARVLLHCHPPYATALACLADPTIYPVDQNTARFHRARVAYDHGFDGLAEQVDEGVRLARVLGDANVLMMTSHGVAVAGATVAEAFEELYYLERACKTLILAYSSGQPLSLIPEDLAEKVALSWDGFCGMSYAHFGQLKEILDREDAGYRL